MYQDRVCLDKEAHHCSNKFNLLGLTSTSRLKNLRSSGLVGMAPSSYDSRCHLFINEMKLAGAIEQKVFSFYITDFFKAMRESG